MPTLVNAQVDRRSCWAKLTFSYDLSTVALIKSCPGSRWDPSGRCWWVPYDAWRGVLAPALGRAAREVSYVAHQTPIPARFLSRLRDYQIEGAAWLCQGSGLLTFQQRLGKTPTAIAAAQALMEQGEIDCAVVLFLAGVGHVWEDAIRAWGGTILERLYSTQPLSDPARASLRARPGLFLGCHYEILEHHRADILEVIRDRRAVVIYDEIQSVQNRKAARTQSAHEISRAARFRWGLTGTPMRNSHRNMWAIWDAIVPDGMGSYWRFAKRYAGAKEGEFGWEDHENTHPEELAARLTALSLRRTRAEVAGHLPKTDRSVILCGLTGKAAKTYATLEQRLAGKLRGKLHSDTLDPAARMALEELSQITAEGKIPTIIARVRDHAERGVKIIVFAHFHDTLRRVVEKIEVAADSTLPPRYVAGGWLPPGARHEAIQSWKAHPGAAVLLANTISSGVGIDLADAEVGIFAELEWVPADFLQAEARLEDVHLGKRTTGAILEYILVENTIDQDMGSALLTKLRAIDAVVGADADSRAVAGVLRESDIAGARTPLESTDKIAIQAALVGLRARLLGDPGSAGEVSAGDAAATPTLNIGWDDDPVALPPAPSAEDEIPF